MADNAFMQFVLCSLLLGPVLASRLENGRLGTMAQDHRADEITAGGSLHPGKKSSYTVTVAIGLLGLFGLPTVQAFGVNGGFQPHGSSPRHVAARSAMYGLADAIGATALNHHSVPAGAAYNVSRVFTGDDPNAEKVSPEWLKVRDLLQPSATEITQTSTKKDLSNVLNHARQIGSTVGVAAAHEFKLRIKNQAETDLLSFVPGAPELKSVRHFVKATDGVDHLKDLLAMMRDKEGLETVSEVVEEDLTTLGIEVNNIIPAPPVPLLKYQSPMSQILYADIHSHLHAAASAAHVAQSLPLFSG